MRKSNFVHTNQNIQGSKHSNFSGALSDERRATVWPYLDKKIDSLKTLRAKFKLGATSPARSNRKITRKIPYETRHCTQLAAIKTELTSASRSSWGVALWASPAELTALDKSF